MSSQSGAIRQVARFTDVSSNPREPCQIPVILLPNPSPGLLAPYAGVLHFGKRFLNEEDALVDFPMIGDDTGVSSATFKFLH